jgi:farnesyl diphosphate synthase
VSAGLALDRYRERIERWMDRRLPAETDSPERLHRAMRYAVLGGGKRVRPLLVYLTGEALDVPVERLDAPACAVELIHAYSLVHDDLPAMDDDDLRRGRPTCHRAFDDATAILAGDALQVMAFDILSADEAMVPDSRQRLSIIRILARASGPAGMAGGQAMDLAATGQPLSLDELEMMHRMKTGALIKASVMMAAHSADDPDPEILAALDTFGETIGLAFQIQDDILDVESDTETLGKRSQADAALAKPTFPSVAGLTRSKERLTDLHASAVASLGLLGEAAEPLVGLSALLTRRRY